MRASTPSCRPAVFEKKDGKRGALAGSEAQQSPSVDTNREKTGISMPEIAHEALPPSIRAADRPQREHPPTCGVGRPQREQPLASEKRLAYPEKNTR